MNQKIDITSSVLEKGVDAAKDFLNKLVLPAVEETGLLLKDQVMLWKFKNQVRILNRAKQYCEKNNISPKTISLKILCPLLDYSAMEEEEVMQDTWAILLSNMVDSAQNIENHVFPYILSQLSSNEFLVLERAFESTVRTPENLDIPKIISLEGVPAFEIANMTRLGLVKEEREFFANSQTIEIPHQDISDSLLNRRYTSVDVDIDLDSEVEYVLTELGELFISACKEKSKK